MLVSSNLLLYFQRCSRRAFLDVFIGRRRQDPFEDFLIKLRQDSSDYRDLTLSNYDYQQPQYASEAWWTGFQATIELMEAGASSIYRGVLTSDWRSGVTLLAQPDLLVRVPGVSRFGNWAYMTQDIRFGKRPKQDYQIVAAFNTFVLSQVQETWATSAEILLRGRRPHTVDLARRVPEMYECVEQCIATLRNHDEPELFLSRQKCSLCHWLQDCHRHATYTQHLSLLPGVTPNRYQQLQELKVNTIADIVALPFDRLRQVVGDETAYQLIRQACANLWQVAIPHNFPLNKLQDFDSFNKSLTDPNIQRLPLTISPGKFALDFPPVEIELHFDIEAEPDLNVEFLLGVLEVNHSTKTEVFHKFFAEKPGQEAEIWQQFVAFMLSRPHAPIYHFCDYEVKTIERLGQRYQTPIAQRRAMIQRCVDVHWWTTKTVILPVESYSLKAMARSLGFRWRDAQANGAQCICWYNEWLKTGDRRYVNWILDYNEDDCRATYHLKTWLVNFLQVNPHPAPTKQQNPEWLTHSS